MFTSNCCSLMWLRLRKRKASPCTCSSCHPPIFSTPSPTPLRNSIRRKSSTGHHLCYRPKGRRSISEKRGSGCQINPSVRSASVSSNLTETRAISVFEHLRQELQGGEPKAQTVAPPVSLDCAVSAEPQLVSVEARMGAPRWHRDAPWIRSPLPAPVPKRGARSLA